MSHETDVPSTKATRLPIKNTASVQLGREARDIAPTHDAPRGFYAVDKRIVPVVHETPKAKPSFTTGLGSVTAQPGQPVTAPFDVTARRVLASMSLVQTGDAINYGGKTFRHGMTPPSGDFLIPKGASFTIDAPFAKVISWGK